MTWVLYYAGFYVHADRSSRSTRSGSFRLADAAARHASRSRSTAGPWSTRCFKREQKWHVTGSKGAYRPRPSLHDAAGALLRVPRAHHRRRRVEGPEQRVRRAWPWRGTPPTPSSSAASSSPPGREARSAQAPLRAARLRARSRRRRCRMTWASRFRLLAGLLRRRSCSPPCHLPAEREQGLADERLGADPRAETYDVGTPYAGLVVDQLVEVGDTVARRASRSSSSTRRPAQRHVARASRRRPTSAQSSTPRAGSWSPRPAPAP